MATTVEPVQSFAYLCENIPRWLTKLDELNAQCDEQYERFYKLTKHGEVKLTRKERHVSTESLRPRDNVTPKSKPPAPAASTTELPEATPTSPTNDISTPPASSQPTQTPPNNTSDPPTSNQQPTLKRKQASASSAASGKGGYRTKSMIVVYYDSTIQERFESIVKDVSNARSNLRKGRTTATFQARMASMAPSLEQNDVLSSPKFIMPSFGRLRGDAAEKQKYKVHDEADRDLEEAQNLSEKAAHQFLRDGDCNAEIAVMRRRFCAVRDLAEQEHDRLKRKKAEEPEGGREGDSTDVLEVSQTLAAGKNISAPTFPALPISISPSDPIAVDMPPPKQMHFAATGTIEVDDAASDASSLKIDMDAIRRVTRRAV